MKRNEYVLDDELIEVGCAADFQDSVRNSKVLTFSSQDLRLKILETNPSEILVVKSNINSPKEIISVETYGESLNSI